MTTTPDTHQCVQCGALVDERLLTARAGELSPASASEAPITFMKPRRLTGSTHSVDCRGNSSAINS